MSNSTALTRNERISHASPHPKMHAKRSYEGGGCYDHQSIPSKFKYPRPDVVRDFPGNCGSKHRSTNQHVITHAEMVAVSSSEVHFDGFESVHSLKSPKLDPTLKKQVPYADETDTEHIRQAGDLGSSELFDGANYVAVAIPAVPLRCVEPSDVDDWKKVPEPHDNIENQARPPKETWKYEEEKIAAVIGEAQELSVEPSNVGDSKMLPESHDNIENQARSPKETWKNEEEEIAAILREAQELLKLSEALYSAPENRSRFPTSEDLSRGSNIVVEPQGTENLYLVDSDCDDATFNKPGVEVSDCELNEYEETDMEVVESVYYMEQREDMENFETDDSLAIVVHASANEANYYQDRELVNLHIVQHDPAGAIKVREALNLFEDYYKDLLHKTDGGKGKGKGMAWAYSQAAYHLKEEGMWIHAEKPFGHIAGVEIGDKFSLRAELAIIGLHRQLMSGIDYVVLGGKKFATSVVNSGRYDNWSKTCDVLIYSGQGGSVGTGDKAANQKLEKGNLALVNSMEMGYPVRVTHKTKNSTVSNITSGVRKDYEYTYDGLYTIKKYWEEKSQNCKMVFKFELQRLPNHPRPHKIVGKSKKSIPSMEVCMLNDISNGKEKVGIHAWNGVDDEKPLPFTYTTSLIYPKWFQLVEPIGCDCINGCSDSQPCHCVLKNGGEIPFNEKGSLVQAKPLLHECGPQCKCPHTCMNRVSQHGPKYQLDIFKTKSRGWGVRSRNYITSGSFICEYIGELLRDREADERIDNDEYLFDISQDEVRVEGFLDGFAIDAAKYGNIGRFINHSCSPNLYAQDVLYDHDNKRVPHVMFFATKNIPPLQELSYDYNYNINRVCDANGKIKKKACHCGSRNCTRRLY